jgi:hypothetical protein
MPFKDPAKQREAIRKSVAKWRTAHPAEAKERQRRYSEKRRTSKRTLVDEIKDVPCMDCGQRFPPYCMDFDHRDPAMKVTEVASLTTSGHSVQTVLDEIAKCDIVCANCHRKRTFNRRNGYQAAAVE